MIGPAAKTDWQISRDEIVTATTAPAKRLLKKFVNCIFGSPFFTFFQFALS
jgi:hypothetical protein